MARSRQTAKKGGSGGIQLPPATFPHAKPIKKPAHKRRLGPVNDLKVPVAVQLARENVALRHKSANAIQQGFYKAPEGGTKNGKR